MPPAVAAILVNYNAGAELRTALRSFADEMQGRSWEAVVVDNASTDGSAAIVREFAPEARLLPNTENVGFGRAANQGIEACSAPRVLIMNPDCRLASGAVRALESVLEAHVSCAVVGPRILDPDGSVQGSARGDPDMFTGLFGRTALLRRWLPRSRLSRRNVVTESTIPAGASAAVDWVSGACMLARRDALGRAGGFDERYFLYWEDADLCRRLRALGYEIRYAVDATAVHHVGHSSRTARAAAIRAFHDSAYLYYATHVAPGTLDPRRLLGRAILGARRRWELARRGREG